MYRLLFSVVFARLPAETAHRAGFGLIRWAAAVPGMSWLLRTWLAPSDPVLRVRALGLRPAGPAWAGGRVRQGRLGAGRPGSAGFRVRRGRHRDRATAAGQPAAAAFRLPCDRALINRMGFNNHGAAAVAERLRSRHGRSLSVGVEHRQDESRPGAGRGGDYAASARLLAGVADYLVVNVSSPNTPGLRNLQATRTWAPLVAAVRGRRRRPGGSRRWERVPLLVKIAPDLADEDIDALADLALELGLDGIIATNTTITRDHLGSGPAAVVAAGAGGLSGCPAQGPPLQVLRQLRAPWATASSWSQSGGIETADDAWERIQAGATLLQAYTGFVYGGPVMAPPHPPGLARRTREAGLASIRQAIGTSQAQAPRRSG